MELKRGSRIYVKVIVFILLFFSILLIGVNLIVLNYFNNLDLSKPRSISAGASSGIVNLFVEGEAEAIPPVITIQKPDNTTYGEHQTELLYTYYDQYPGYCWYSLDGGLTTTSIECGVNVTNITSLPGSNTWIIYGNDSYGNMNFSSVTFSVVFPTESIIYSTSRSGGGGLGLPIYKNIQTFKINMDVLEKSLDLGEVLYDNITILNTAEIENDIDVLIDKSLKGILFINNNVKIPATESRNMPIKIYGEKEGVYNGNIYFFGKKVTTMLVNETFYTTDGYNVSIANTRQVIEVVVTNITYVLPTIIIVKSKAEKLLNLDVTLDENNIRPGDMLGFTVSIYNLGALNAYDFDIVYEILRNEDEITITSLMESYTIDKSLFLYKQLKIPEDAKLGEHDLIVTAYFGNLSVVREVPFIVSQGFELSPLLEGFKTGAYYALISLYLPIILAILFLLIILIIAYYYFRYLKEKLFEKKMAELKKKSIYVFPDFKLLPKSKFAYIGHVADTGVKTYLDHTQLNRHTLIAGGTGSGKTVAGMVVVEELLRRRGYSVIVFDPTGQWTGFLEKNRDKNMLSMYKKFGLSGRMAFNPRIIEISERTMYVDIISYLKMNGMTIFKLDKLSPEMLDEFIELCLERIYRANLPEAGSLKHLIVLDEVHRLLPKYGGRRAHIKLEQAVREFRKWGVGLLMISQVLTDFKGAIRGNIGTEIQLRTRYEGDIKRVKDRHGIKISSIVPKMPTGVAMIECSEYNKGLPYYVEFRPLLHSQFKLVEKVLSRYVNKAKVLLTSALELRKARSKLSKLEEKNEKHVERKEQHHQEFRREQHHQDVRREQHRERREQHHQDVRREQHHDRKEYKHEERKEKKHIENKIHKHKDRRIGKFFDKTRVLLSNASKLGKNK